MKKSILWTVILLFLFSFSASSKILIDSSGVNGMYRSTLSNITALLKQTNAYRGDLYFLNRSLTNSKAGLWQAKRNSPKGITNWKMVHMEFATNYINTFPGNNSAWTNVVMTSYTQAFHLVLTAQLVIGTNLALIRSTNQANTSMRARVLALSNIMTNRIAVKITALSNDVLTLLMTNRYSGGFLKLNQTNAYSAGILNLNQTNAYSGGFLKLNQTNTYSGGLISIISTATNTIKNNLTNQFCWGEVFQTNISPNTWTPATNTSQKGVGGITNRSGWTTWTNVTGYSISTPTTNLIGYLTTTRQMRIGSVGVGNYEIGYDCSFVASTTNPLTFAILLNNTSKARFVKTTEANINLVGTIHKSAIVTISAPTVVDLGVCQPNAQTTTVSLKQVILWIKRIR